MIKLPSAYKVFHQVVFTRLPLPGNISINTLAVLFSFFISKLTCCICAKKFYISNRFIAICHMPLYCHIVIFFLRCCSNSQKTKSIYLIAQGFMCFFPTRGCLGHSHYSFVSKPVGKAGWKMSSTHIRHVLQTRIRIFLYNGVV